MRAWSKGVAFLVFVLGVLAGGVPAAMAQVDPDLTSTDVIVTICLDDACSQRENVAGAVVNAYDVETGELVGSCTTDANGYCAVETPNGPENVTIDVESGLDPAQYAPKDGWTPYAEDGALFFGFEQLTAPEPTTETVVAVVYSCDTAGCASDEVKDVLPGATVVSFTADGTELDSCTVGEVYELGCDLVIPVDDSGTYDVTAPAGYGNYVLLNSTPDVTGEGGDGREWTFAPAEEPGDGFAVNVVACDEVGCADPVTMDGAVVTSFDGTGEQIDSCTVQSETADFDGCIVMLPASSGSVEITPSEAYADYVLVSNDPEVFESEERGRIYLWTFVPAGGGATETPDATEEPEPTAVATQSPVTALPETGTGTSGTQVGLLVFAISGVVALALAAMSARLARR